MQPVYSLLGYEMNSDQTSASLRRVDRSRYPELRGYTDAEIWHDSMGPGGLYLAVDMSRHMGLRKNDLVLDLGCGRGESSVFLVKHYGVRVIAADLRVEATFLSDKFRRRGCASDVVPLNVDARAPLPFAADYFDAVFCMNSLSFFGGDVESLCRLVSHLKRGGSFCVGGECMSSEFTEEQKRHPPQVYSFIDGIWEGDFLKLHSPPWWHELFTSSGVLDVNECKELENGVILHEEKLVAAPPEGYLGLSAKEAKDIELRQILYGRENEPYMTVFVASASRR